MVYRIINEIKINLETSLCDVVPDNTQSHIVIGPIDTVAKKDLPLITIVPGEIEFFQKVDPPVQISEGQRTLRKSFGQDLIISIYDEKYDMIDKISSIVFGDLSINEKDIVKSCNLNAAGYSSSNLKTNQVFESIQVKGGTIEKFDDNYKCNFELNIKGIIEITKTITEGFEQIQEVVINNNEENS